MGCGIWGRVAQKWMGGERWDEWVPMGCGIWGWVAQRWTYGAQGLMGPYGIGDLGLNGPKVELWDRDEDGDGWGPIRSGIWGWKDQSKRGFMGPGRGCRMNGALWDVGFGVGWS